MEPLSTGATFLGAAALTKAASSAANTELGRQLYEDLAKGAVQEVGGMLTDATKFARTCLTNYARAWVEAPQRVVDEVNAACAEIPPERLVEPKPHVVEPIYRGLALRDEGDLLSDMFKRLLRQVFDKDTQGKVMPSFASLIAELSPDEAMVLYVTKQMTQFVYPHPDLSNPSVFPLDRLAEPQEFDGYIDHLMAKGLLEVGNGPLSINMPVPVPNFTREQHAIRQYRQADIPLYGLQQVAEPGASLRLTRFGSRFADVCIPSELPKVVTEAEQAEMAVDQ